MRILTGLIILLLSIQSWAWGERGHHLIGETAARLVDEQLQHHPKATKLGLYFQKRALQMGHLNNVPDISWKSQKNPIIREHNNPSHYFDIEHFLGMPEKTNDKQYLKRVWALPDNFAELRKQYDGKPHPIKGTPLNIYKDSGTAIYRIAELFDRAKDLMKCASEREGDKFNAPLFPMLGTEVVESTKCESTTTRLEALLASTTLMGMMGHFVADLSQPQHNSTDYNGWLTKQGGLHSYFETDLILAMSEGLTGKVAKRAETIRNNGMIEERLGKDWKKLSPAKLSLRLSADGFSNLDKLRRMDRKYALLSESVRDDAKKIKDPAKRRSPNDPNVWKKFESFAIDRMATSTVVLAHLWGKIWSEGGQPDVADLVFWKAPYPLDSAFILNNYRPMESPKKTLVHTDFCNH